MREKIKNSSGNMLNSICLLDTQVEVPSKQFSMSSYQPVRRSQKTLTLKV